MKHLVDWMMVSVLAMPIIAVCQVRPSPNSLAPAPASGGNSSGDSSPHYAIHVLDGRTREPVANAEVHWVTFQGRDPWFANHDEALAAIEKDESAIAASDRVAATDSAGIVAIPVEGSRALVHVKEGSRFGTESLLADYASSESIQLLLWPDFDVGVRVVDRSGVAADRVPLVLQSFDGGYLRRESTSATDERGVATFRHVGRTMEEEHAYRIARRQEDKSWEVSLDVCLASVVSPPAGSVVAAPVRLNAPPKAPLELVLPATGSVVVEGVDAHGSRVDLGGDGYLTTRSRFVEKADAFRNRSSSQHRRGRPNFVAQGVFDEGRFRFPRVGLGIDLVALVSRNDASSFVHVEGAGPKRENDEVTLRVTVGTTGLVLRGRVVDERREPIVHGQLSAWLDTVNEPDVNGPEVYYHELGSLVTDRLGRFAIDLEPFEPRFSSSTSLVLAMSRNLSEAREGIVDLPRSPLRGEVDAGDFVLAPAPIVASGRIVDELGAPVSHCWIEGPTWKTMDSGVNAMTDEQGRFALRGILLDKKLELSLRAPLRPRRRLSDLLPGRRDLVVRMPRSGGLKARIQLPAGSGGSRVSFSLHHLDDGSDGAYDNVTGGIEEDGGIFVDGRWPGPWSLVVTRDGSEILRRNDIVIRGGEITDLGVLALDGVKR